jgi:hypothetical protein
MAANVQEFCLDMGLDWLGLIRGDSLEITKLAELSGADASNLQRHAFRVIDRGRLRIGRETGHIGSVRRASPKGCVDCLVESVAREGFSGASRKSDWQFVSIRTCERHHRPLVLLPAESIPIQNYDFVGIVRRNWTVVEGLTRLGARRSPSDLEGYLRNRIAGGSRGNEWIDQLSLPIVAKASEALGVRLEYGSEATLKGISDEQLHFVAAKGFQVLQAGPDRLRDALQGFKAEFNRHGSFHHRDLGAFFAWLNQSRNLPTIRTLKNLVLDHIIENYPIDPGASVLGRRIDRPRCFSLTSARRKLGVRRERLNYLMAGLAITSDCGASPPTYLAEHQVELLKSKIDDAISVVEAAQILDCRYEQVIRFVIAGMLRRSGGDAVKPFLSKREVAAFVAPVEALKPGCANGNLMTMERLCSVVKASVHEIYNCFLTNQLASARRDLAKAGLGSLLLDPDEVRRHLSTPETTDPTMIDVARQLKSNTRTLRYLAGRGELHLYKARHPTTRNLTCYVDSASLLEFQKGFVTIGQLAEAFGQLAGPLSIQFDTRGLRPRQVPKGVGRIYHRADIERAFEPKLPHRSPNRPIVDTLCAPVNRNCSPIEPSEVDR